MGEDAMAPVFVSTKEANSGRLVSELLKCVLEHDVNVMADKNIPEKIKQAIVDKFSYAIVKGREDHADGGLLRGYQILDRLFVGTVEPTAVELETGLADEFDEEVDRRDSAHRGWGISHTPSPLSFAK